MKQYFSFTILLVILFSCNDDAEQADRNKVGTIDKALTPFQKFTRKFKTVPLPFNYSGWENNEGYRKKSFKLSQNSADTVYYKQGELNPVYGYGMLTDTSRFYSLIYFGEGEDIYPILITYSKAGLELKREPLIVRGCGSDCGLKSCSYTAHIGKDLSIYIADTLKYEGMCDEKGNYYPNSDSTFIYAKKGKINSSGEITMSEEVEQKLKGAE